MNAQDTQTYRLRLGPKRGISDRRQGKDSSINLDRCQVRSLQGGPPLKAVVCIRGRVWITQEKDLQDYILESGEIFILTLPGRTVVHGLEASRIEIINDLTPVTNKGSYEQSVFR